MSKKNIPEDIEPCCELCEYAFKMEMTGELLCKYKNALKRTDCTDVCRHFSFDIFSYKPKTAKMPKAFDFTKI